MTLKLEVTPDEMSDLIATPSYDALIFGVTPPLIDEIVAPFRRCWPIVAGYRCVCSIDDAQPYSAVYCASMRSGL